jgi:hypothetical protein
MSPFSPGFGITEVALECVQVYGKSIMPTAPDAATWFVRPHCVFESHGDFEVELIKASIRYGCIAPVFRLSQSFADYCPKSPAEGATIT